MPHDALNAATPAASTYEVRWAGQGHPVVAITVTVLAETRMDAIAKACKASSLSRDHIESVREV
jgi:hypothetical protein